MSNIDPFHPPALCLQNASRADRNLCRASVKLNSGPLFHALQSCLFGFICDQHYRGRMYGESYTILQLAVSAYKAHTKSNCCPTSFEILVC